MVTWTDSSLLFTAVDPASTKTAGVVLDLDLVPVSLVASLHAVFPELQIVGLTSNPATASVDRQAGATVVIAKPASVTAIAQAVRQLILRKP